MISICLDIDGNKELAKKALAKMGVAWPVYFTGGETYNDGLTKELRDRYSILTSPLILLLNRDGVLVHESRLSGRIDPFEEKIQEMLSQGTD